MSKLKSIILLLTITLLVSGFFGSSFAQSREELQQKRKKLLGEITFTTKLINATKLSKQESLDQLITLKKQISLREELIRNVRREINLLDKQIEDQQEIIEELEADMNYLKDQYAKMMVSAYKTQTSQNKLLFLFSAQSFNDLYKRYNYLEKYRIYRITQADLIIRTQQDLEDKIKSLNAEKNNKENLLADINAQKKSIRKEVSEENSLVTSLQKKEKKLKKNLSNKRKTADQLKKAIEDLIRKELEAARRNEMGLTPRALKLSKDFTNNRGKLPWPVQKGIITSKFGKQKHPIFNIETFNNGVDIKTTKNAEVRTLFGGTVVSVIYNPSFHKAVLIQHGEYFTVYSNLDKVIVKPNDEVTTGQNIGTAYTDEQKGITEVHLEIWKGEKTMNPDKWLHK
ncbi:MAG: peptidoglycan DD-metalloendopeptidase family protein [Bacteroidetes bacterium]|nr:peptidoglycan DD-metalloendopeptidase family protein [Bacteroidota bacterium]